MTYERLVVVGDSCAEGLDDPYPDSDVYRGWADLVALRLAELTPDLRYANLAIRGKRLDQIVTEQIPAVATLAPDVVALFGGVNDLLGRGCDAAEIHRRVDEAVRLLRETCPTVIVFTVGDISRQTPMLRGIRGRLRVLNIAIRSAADRHGAVLVDLETLEVVQDLRYFGPDRMHLADHGHRRVAAHVLAALGVDADRSWLSALPGTPVSPGLRGHASWCWEQALPAVVSRVRNVVVGRRPGDGFRAKHDGLVRVTAG